MDDSNHAISRPIGSCSHAGRGCRNCFLSSGHAHLPHAPGSVLLRDAARRFSFHWAKLPMWLDITDPRCPYGFGDIESRGVKVAFDLHGEPFDPDSVDRFVSAERVHEMRQFLGDRFPALRNTPLNETRVCQYENTSNGDFLIDRHPHFENVWICGGGSGHGFKHGPAVGEYTSAMVLGTGTAEPRFSFGSKIEVRAQ